MNNDLHVKYRPQSFDQVLGQAHVVTSLLGFKQQGYWPHAYLFTGGSGCGKTTLSRILANELHTHPSSIMEIDAATFNGVETMRALTSDLQYTSFGDNATKFIILDECFAPGTLITTPNGQIKIEDLKIGDTVCNLTGQAKIKHVFANVIPCERLVKVHLTNGKNIICSCDHLFFTTQGWIEAKNLTEHSILIGSNLCYTESLIDFEDHSDARKNVPSLRQTVSESKNGELFQEGSFERMLKQIGIEIEKTPLCLSMPSLSNHFYIAKTTSNTSDMFNRVWKQTGRNKKNWTTLRSQKKRAKDWFSQIQIAKTRIMERAVSTIFGEDVTNKSITQSRNYSKSQANQTGKGYFKHLGWKTWWQRNLNRSTSCSSNGFGLEYSTTERVWKPSHLWDVVCRVSNKDWAQQFKSIWLSTSLQVRHWMSGCKNFYRGGWRWSQIESQCLKRLEKRFETDGTRVDHVEIFKRGDNEQSFNGVIDHSKPHLTTNFVTLYDLEIDGHPSYFAEGCLVHNCHQLSKSAWNALLKAIEEPPAHVYFAFCTTEVDKVPDTIRTRCHQYNLKSVSTADLLDLLCAVADLEEIKLSEKMLALIAQESLGSPRRALTFLSKAQQCTTMDELKDILESADEDADVIELCRLLVGKVTPTWKSVLHIVRRLDTKNPESIRLTVLAYVSKVLLNMKTESGVEKLLAILEAFSKPYNTSEKMAPVLLSIGQLFISDK